MGKTTLIAQLMAPFAAGAFIVGYSTAETAELMLCHRAEWNRQSGRGSAPLLGLAPAEPTQIVA